MTFKELGVKQEIVEHLAQQEITDPTPIQAETIGLGLQGEDVIGVSKTGSGKTLAFSIPLVQKIAKGKGIQALVIAPTRELAVQIAGEIKKISTFMHLNVTLVYGGVAIGPQIHSLRSAEVVVGTPGRILDHLDRQTINFSHIKFVVLDEADRLVDMGFIDDVERIISATPTSRQTMLFGATISDEIENIKRRRMKHPKTVKAAMQVEATYLKQYYYDIQPREKFSLLVHLLKKHQSKTMIFCATRRTVDIVLRNLRKQNVPAEAMHGGLSQNRRNHVIESFHRGKPRVLIATAVAARGLDIKDVTHIINYDLSQNAEEYIHKVGRTARAGKSGEAITLLSPRDHATFSQITARFPVDVVRMPKENFPQVGFHMGPRDDGDRGGHRGGYGARGGGHRGGYGSRGEGGARHHGGPRGGHRGGGGYHRRSDDSHRSHHERPKKRVVITIKKNPPK